MEASQIRGLIYALMLAGIAVSTGVVVYTQADGGMVDIDNVPPTIVDAYVTTGASFTQADTTGGQGGRIDLVAAQSSDVNSAFARTIRVTGSVEDLNGGNDVQEVSVVFHHSAVPPSCTLDAHNCYGVRRCEMRPGPTPTQQDFNCTILLEHWTSSSDIGGAFPETDWIVHIEARDAEGGYVQYDALHKEIGTLLAVSVPERIDFGTVQHGEFSSVSTTYIAQGGNDEASIEVSLPHRLECDVRGGVEPSDIFWSLNPDTDLYTALTSTAQYTDITIPYRSENMTTTAVPLFWKVYAPHTARGLCSGAITFTAVAR